MDKLTALELEKIQQHQSNNEKLGQMKLHLGDLITQTELLKAQLVSFNIEVMNESEQIKTQLELKYGKDFTIQPDGSIIKPESEEIIEELSSDEL